ncbi:DDB1- and CUL4-associated factor 15 isoform X2 [Protopterus annectens]|uniref:DDB1- and CUL4-associated factor 15 isoform X2 n=1 Tax=Protopterus annectens TaxID=7888 RepID=UPI001CFBA3AC|nr:DDB1- and CUL4-associated factor 15 isoform X2 [Protopterus annectens]
MAELLLLTGQLSQRVFRKLPPRVCVPLKNIVYEEFLQAGHIFLGFTKCGRYVLSYTSDSGDDDFSFYIYHLYWWEFHIHKKLKLVRQVRLFQDEEIYSDLYLTVCEWPSDSSKIIVFGFNTRSANGMLMNLMMSDENHRDIYISVVAMPQFTQCSDCRDRALTRSGGLNSLCLQHSFMLHTKYQVVYPFPTFQPAFQLKKDHVVLLNTSFSLIACAISVHRTGDSEHGQILYHKKSCQQKEVGDLSLPEKNPGGGLVLPETFGVCTCDSRSDVLEYSACTEDGNGTVHSRPPNAAPGGSTALTDESPVLARARQFVADIFRRARVASADELKVCVATGESTDVEQSERTDCNPASVSSGTLGSVLDKCCSCTCSASCCCSGVSVSKHKTLPHEESDTLAANSSVDIVADPCTSSFHGPESSSRMGENHQTDTGYMNYTKLRYVLDPVGYIEQECEYEDDKISLPFVVTDLKGRCLQPLKDNASVQGPYLTVEQLSLDFEYVINEVIRNDASWSKQFCSFSDYDIVILEVCPETNQVVINIGLMLLAFPLPTEEGQLRPKTYHTSLKVAWDLSTGLFVTVSVGDLTEVKGQTSGSVWSSYRKSCVDMVMKWLVPESSGRYVNRMTNEALHKGCSLKVLADSERYTWIVL